MGIPITPTLPRTAIPLIAAMDMGDMDMEASDILQAMAMDTDIGVPSDIRPMPL